MKSKEQLIQDRDSAISQARWILMNPYFIIDTETTGLNDAQMCQLAVIRSDGAAYKSLVKPTIPIEAGAIAVHHITDDMVKDAPIATQVVLDLPTCGFMLAYNINFDTKVIINSLLKCGIDFAFNPQIIMADVMLLYAQYHGDWDDYHANYRWQKLKVACQQCGLTLEESADGYHDAMYDVRMTENLLKYISCQKLSTEEQ